MKIRIIIASVIILLLGILSILNLNTTNSVVEEKREIENFVESTTTESATTSTKTTTTKKVTKKTTKKITMNVIASQQEMLKYTLEQVLRMGWNSNEYEIVVKLVSHESSWNPNSVNKKSGACGLFQANPCNKVFKQYPDYTTNYKSQINWGLNYIKERYKTPSEAWRLWLSRIPHWY